MIILTSKDKRLLGLACLEEIEYFLRAQVVPIVGRPDKETVEALTLSAKLLIQKYKHFIEILDESTKENSSVDINPKDLITLCNDHIQTVRKHEVFKVQFDGTVTQKGLWSTVVEIMMASRDKYIADFEDLKYRLGLIDHGK